MPLDPTPLRNAVQRLREGLARHRAEPADEHIRDGLSHRMLRRRLAEDAASPDAVAATAFAELIRAGNEAGLVRGAWPAWQRFREMRARTSRTCDAGTAAEVAAAIPEFLAEAEHLLAALERRG